MSEVQSGDQAKVGDLVYRGDMMTDRNGRHTCDRVR